ncbi:MAG: LysR family transcriptional regulator [Lachnospiraceae bacterium]|nr:LysR family transcriptional regulator [Lachnospiraceae bacterium]
MKQINSLENRIGVKLFVRTNHGISLTPAGEELYKQAKKLIAAGNAAIKSVRNIGGYKQHTIRVGTSLMRPCKMLVDLWAKLDTHKLPYQIEIVPFDDNPTGLNAMMESLGADIDCYVGPFNSIQWLEQYSFYPLGLFKCCCAVPRNHPLASKERLSWSDLSGENFMLIKQGESLILDRLRKEIENNHPDIHLVDIPNIYGTSIFNECEQRGYIMETLEIWSDIHPGLVTIPVEWEYEMPYGIIYGSKPSKDFQEFISVLAAAK